MSEIRLSRRITFFTMLSSALAVFVIGSEKAAWSKPASQMQAAVTATQKATVMSTPSAISTSVVSTVAAIPPALLARLPKDEQGRVIGGPYVPYLNYSPTMITGKKCPRVTKWTWKVVNLAPPLRPYGQVDDPCVVQNAIDDFVRTEFADPAVNTPESMKKIEPLYATDPAIVDGLMPTIRDSYLKLYREGKTPYYVCDKPQFKLLDASARSPLIANNDGMVSGNALQVTVYVVSQNIEPFTCQLLSLKDNTRIGTLTRTAAQLQGKQRVLQVNLLWNTAKARWAVYDFGAAEVDNFYQAAKALWDAALLKP
jgi:hypothetical protein